MPTLNKIRTATPWGRSNATVDPAIRRLRAALTLFFALDGFIFAGWVVRIPAIKQQTGASTGALGLALLGVSAGAVATMMVTGRLCQRFGHQPMTVVAAVVMSLSVALPAHTHSALALGLVLLVFGAGYGGLNVAMNSAAVDLVAALRRPVMPTFHAAFSLGGMLGAGLGGLVAGRLSATTHLTALTVCGLALTAFAGRALLTHPVPRRQHERPATPTAPRRRPSRPEATDPAHHPSSTRAEPGGRFEPVGEAAGRGAARRTRRLVAVFGLIALCTAYGEGALADWGALHLEQDLDAHPGVAAAGYSVFAATMTIGRLSGTALLERLGQTRALVAGGATAATGMLVGSLAPTVWLALLGFAVTGLGLANIFPIAIERAGALNGPSGVATASTFGYGGMLCGPPAIGFVADWFSLPTALTTVALLAAIAAAVAYASRNALRPPAS
ncbi:MFS transporter [Streptomyces sp. 71268]|uniref:MFS transporter n=1 Tax=Streptomyces sp. 71268 TaxID=3002640 RepID=UPI0023F9FE5C|nr:MFS transporter [Streptomyces sp. 71268]WEV24209.1 MFS transporter [Streptomyces sp. 71268]